MLQDEQQYASIAAIRTFYNDNDDGDLGLLGAICDIVLSVIKNGMIADEVREEYLSTYFSNIPRDVLETALKRLKKDEKIHYASRHYNIYLTQKGEDVKAEHKKSIIETNRDFSSLSEGLFM